MSEWKLIHHGKLDFSNKLKETKFSILSGKVTILYYLSYIDTLPRCMSYNPNNCLIRISLQDHCVVVKRRKQSRVALLRRDLLDYHYIYESDIDRFIMTIKFFYNSENNILRYVILYDEREVYQKYYKLTIQNTFLEENTITNYKLVENKLKNILPLELVDYIKSYLYKTIIIFDKIDFRV